MAMQTYKATNGVNSYLNNFADLAAAQAYYLPILGAEYSVALASASEQIPVKSDAEKLKSREVFGESLIKQFRLDNAAAARARGYAITKAEGKQLIAKLRDAMDFAELGSLEILKEEIATVATDSIFTDARKTKYIQDITNFLASE